MITSQDFFEELRDGQEWTHCLMTMETYSGLHHEYKELIVLGDVRKKNDKFKDDPVHKELSKNKYKATKELRNYEFDQNYK